jgi:multiple sugar transport system permease protein
MTKLKLVKERKKIVSFVLLLLLCIAFTVPLLWAFGTSFKKNALTDPISIFPKEFSFKNYVALFSNENAPVLRWFGNSIFVSGVHTVLYLIVASLAGYAFGVLKWKGRDLVFWLLLSTAMIPGIINLVSLYQLTKTLSINGTALALILPGLGGVLYMFLLRQNFMMVPKELIEAAKLDGCTSFGIFIRVIVPLSTSTFMVVAMMTFINSWNDYLWPSVALAGADVNKLTLPLGIAKLLGDNNMDNGLTMAGAIVSMLPTIIVYLFLQNRIIESVANSGSKE